MLLSFKLFIISIFFAKSWFISLLDKSIKICFNLENISNPFKLLILLLDKFNVFIVDISNILKNLVEIILLLFKYNFLILGILILSVISIFSNKLLFKYNSLSLLNFIFSKKFKLIKLLYSNNNFVKFFKYISLLIYISLILLLDKFKYSKFDI